MAIVLARIDDRLVHGQVVEGWIPYVQSDLVVVLSQEVAKDSTQRALMRLALPDSVELLTLSVEQAAAFISKGDWDARRVLLLAPGPQEILELIRHGVKLANVNVGGLHYSAGRIQLGRVIFLSAEDQAALKAIRELGVALEGQAVPTDSKMNLSHLLA